MFELGTSNDSAAYLSFYFTLSEMFGNKYGRQQSLPFCVLAYCHGVEHTVATKLKGKFNGQIYSLLLSLHFLHDTYYAYAPIGML